MESLLDQVCAATVNGSVPVIVSSNDDLGSINWVNGLSDPGEMIACGFLPEARRIDGETDQAYRDRLLTVLADRPELIERIKAAAVARASLDTTGGKVALVTAGKLPWHGLGVNVRDCLTWKDAGDLSGLTGWTVFKRELSYQFSGNQIEMPGTFALVRSDTGKDFGVCQKYTPIQNHEAFTFLDDVLRENGAHYESAGSIFGGESIFLCARLPRQDFQVAGLDRQESYAVFTNSHRVGKAAKCFPTSVRVECANTFTMATRRDGDKGISISHSGNVKAKIEQAQEAIGIAIRKIDSYKDACLAMAGTQANPQTFADTVLDRTLPISKAQADMGAAVLARMEMEQGAADLVQEELEKQFSRAIKRRETIKEEILERYESEQNSGAETRGTTWHAFNAVTDYADHTRIGRNAQDQDVWQSRRFESAMEGAADQMKQAAFQVATGQAS